MDIGVSTQHRLKNAIKSCFCSDHMDIQIFICLFRFVIFIVDIVSAILIFVQLRLFSKTHSVRSFSILFAWLGPRGLVEQSVKIVFGKYDLAALIVNKNAKRNSSAAVAVAKLTFNWHFSWHSTSPSSSQHSIDTLTQDEKVKFNCLMRTVLTKLKMHPAWSRPCCDAVISTMYATAFRWECDQCVLRVWAFKLKSMHVQIVHFVVVLM